MIIQNATFGDICSEKTLRYDVDYIKYHQALAKDFYTFNELFSIKGAQSCTEEELSKDFAYCEIGDSDKNGDVSPVILNFENRRLEDESYYTKIEKGDISSVELDDILISKVRPNLKKYIRITEEKKDIFYTTAFIRLQAKEMPDLMYYCLHSIFYKDLMAISRQGKGYPTISEKDLSFLRFDGRIIDKLRLNYEAISSLILTVEEKIVKMKKTLLSHQEIIDFVFRQEFGFDYKKFEELKSKKHYVAKQTLFSNNMDLRFSAKFHRPAGRFVMEQLTGITSKKIKHFIVEPIILGASISPSDFDDSGDAYYVSMATIKTLEIVLDDTQLVSKEYFDTKKATKSLKKGDIIIARSGVAIGKVAIVTDDFEGIFADFTMRVRMDETKCNPQFAYYYLRTTYFQYLIEVYKKGLQNQNIFPIVMQEFPFPDLSLMEQQRIVKKIQLQIAEQDKVREEISSLRKQIEDTIINTVLI